MGRESGGDGGGDVPEAVERLAADLADLELLEARLAEGPVSLAEMMQLNRAALPPKPKPRIGTIDGTEDGVFYPGKSNAIVGEAGKGKSAILQSILIDEAALGVRCLYIDREKSWMDFLDRMVSLGCTSTGAANILYWKPKCALGDLVETVAGMARKYGLRTVVLDSMNRDLAAGGFRENDNDDVRAWYDRTIEPLIEAGVTVIWVDHLRKPDEVRGRPVMSAGRSAKGAIAKLEVLTGAMIILETARPFSQKQAGMVKLRATKDNNGVHTEGTVIAEAHVTPGDEGAMQITLRAPDRHVDADGNFRPTVLMERISTYLEEAGEARSKSRIQEDVVGKENMLAVAADRLVEEGFVKKQAGPRNAQLFQSLRPFREAESDTSEGETF